MKLAAASRSLDNITVVILGLKNFKKTILKLLEGQSLMDIRKNFLAQKSSSEKNGKNLEFFEVEGEELALFQAQNTSANIASKDFVSN